MKPVENPWRATWGDEPPSWLMQRRLAMFRTECPECGAVGRPYYVGGGSPDVRCSSCNARFDRRGHIVPAGGRGAR